MKSEQSGPMLVPILRAIVEAYGATEVLAMFREGHDLRVEVSVNGSGLGCQFSARELVGEWLGRIRPAISFSPGNCPEKYVLAELACNLGQVTRSDTIGGGVPWDSSWGYRPVQSC